MNDKAESFELTDAGIEITSFPAQVWAKLSRVDVGDHIQTATIQMKGGGSYSYQYLGWAWCWATLMQHYPESTFIPLPADIGSDGSVMVNLEICIIDGDNAMSRVMYLPVMDGKFNAIINPSARQVSDTRMRCLVKGLAMHCGLGLDLWTGSDYPVGIESDPLDQEQLDLLDGLFFKLSKENQKAFTRWMGPLADLPKKKYNEARKGLESKLKQQGKE